MFTEDDAWDEDAEAVAALDELEDELPVLRPMLFTPTAVPWSSTR